MKTQTRNSDVLKSFVDYCEANPNERFWQALRNWSGYAFIYASDNNISIHDTFYIEGRNQHEG